MIPYLVIFAIAASFALGTWPKSAKTNRSSFFLVLYAILIALMIGFRWQVGGDWSWDVVRMIKYQDLDIIEFMNLIDPGYGVLMWICTNSGFNVWFLHLMGGAIFAFGLAKFCLNEIHPWLAMTVAVPYLVIVVAMGYDRQAVAIGFVMVAMVALQDRSLKRFIGNMILATSMHETALGLMPIFIFGSRINKFLALIVGGPIFAAGYAYFLQSKAESAVEGYIHTGYSSSGAGIRIAMNAIPALFYIVFRRRFQLTDNQRTFAIVMSMIALAFVVFMILSPSSTAVDRMALYIIPLQLFILGRLPLALAPTPAAYKVLTLGVVTYSLAAMMIWLNFADNAPLWVPYSLIGINRLIGLSN